MGRLWIFIRSDRPYLIWRYPIFSVPLGGHSREAFFVGCWAGRVWRAFGSIQGPGRGVRSRAMVAWWGLVLTSDGMCLLYPSTPYPNTTHPMQEGGPTRSTLTLPCPKPNHIDPCILPCLFFISPPPLAALSDRDMKKSTPNLIRCATRRCKVCRLRQLCGSP